MRRRDQRTPRNFDLVFIYMSERKDPEVAHCVLQKEYAKVSAAKENKCGMRKFSMNFGRDAPRLAAVVGLASSATYYAGDGVVQSSLAWGRPWIWASTNSPQTDNHRALPYFDKIHGRGASLLWPTYDQDGERSRLIYPCSRMLNAVPHFSISPRKGA